VFNFYLDYFLLVIGTKNMNIFMRPQRIMADVRIGNYRCYAKWSNVNFSVVERSLLIEHKLVSMWTYGNIITETGKHPYLRWQESGNVGNWNAI
jgi:hypothetical protein